MPWDLNPLGLGHRVAGDDLAVEQRLQITLLLLVGAEISQDLSIPVVGTWVPEIGAQAAAEDLIQEGEL